MKMRIYRCLLCHDEPITLDILPGFYKWRNRTGDRRITTPMHKEFYVGLLGADVGRENAEWLDILLWGHQITLHQRPDDVLARERQGKRHFGVILPWSEWQQLVEHLPAIFDAEEVNGATL